MNDTEFLKDLAMDIESLARIFESDKHIMAGARLRRIAERLERLEKVLERLSDDFPFNVYEDDQEVYLAVCGNDFGVKLGEIRKALNKPRTGAREE